MPPGKQSDDVVTSWFPGQTHGLNGLGQDVLLSEVLPPSNDDTITTVEAYTDTKVNALKTRLVASGVLPN